TLAARKLTVASKSSRSIGSTCPPKRFNSVTCFCISAIKAVIEAKSGLFVMDRITQVLSKSNYICVYLQTNRLDGMLFSEQQLAHTDGLLGSIEVICGSMFSGKTEELIRRLKRAQLARLQVQIFKPAFDQRY